MLSPMSCLLSDFIVRSLGRKILPAENRVVDSRAVGGGAQLVPEVHQAHGKYCWYTCVGVDPQPAREGMRDQWKQFRRACGRQHDLPGTWGFS